jgi:hypothetical protein
MSRGGKRNVKSGLEEANVLVGKRMKKRKTNPNSTIVVLCKMLVASGTTGVFNAS